MFTVLETNSRSHRIIMLTRVGYFLLLMLALTYGSPTSTRNNSQRAHDLAALFRGMLHGTEGDPIPRQQPIESISTSDMHDEGIHTRQSITFLEREKCTHTTDMRGDREGGFSSENFPEEYSTSEHYCWLIGETGMETTIRFDRRFAVGAMIAGACMWDSLSFYQQGSDEPVLGPYCGEAPPWTLRLMGETLVYFHAYIVNNYDGFSVTFTTQPPSQEECSRSLGRGSIASPSYGQGRYPNNYDECWILGERDSFVDISFESMHIERDPSCSYDYLRLYAPNPHTGEFQLEDTFCGSRTPDDLRFPMGPIKIEFHTDMTEGGSGFKFHYIDFEHEPCEAMDPHGGQISITWREYQLNTTYCWALETDVGVEVSITFSDFDVDGGSSTSCYGDYVRIMDGAGVKRKHCNLMPPAEQYTTTSGIVVIEFVTNAWGTADGFLLTYEVNGNYVTHDGELPCQVLNRDRGGIKTPNYPRGYQPNTHMCWEIHSPSGRPLVVTFERIGMQESYGCQEDYIMLYNGTIARGHPLGKYCSSTIVMPPPAMGGFMTIEFFSNSDEHVGPGVFLWYRTLDEDEEWGYTDDGDEEVENFVDDSSDDDDDDEYSGSNESEGVPSEDHPACGSRVYMEGDEGRISFFSESPVEADLKCKWKIKASRRKRLLFRFKKMDLPESRRCNFGYVKLLEDGRYIGGNCGKVGNELFSWKHQVELEFKSIREFQTRGFVVTYTTFEYDPSIETGTPPCGVVDQMRPHEWASPRIVGGIPAMTHDWPWMVQLLVDGIFICGGSILQERWVITATHCVNELSHKPYRYKVVIGEHDLRVFEGEEIVYWVDEIICHPDYHDLSLANDVCLLRLATPIKWTRHVSPVCITPDNPPVGANAYATGWGNTLDLSDRDVLQEVELRIMDSAEVTGWQGLYVFETMISAGWEEGTKDTCKGDSGGPLVVRRGHRWYLVGVTSWGVSCGGRRSPGVFVRVPYYTDWIRTHTNGDVEPKE